ncbi:hypothetical protein D3C77_481450 [compost metagenome]
MVGPFRNLGILIWGAYFVFRVLLKVELQCTDTSRARGDRSDFVEVSLEHLDDVDCPGAPLRQLFQDVALIKSLQAFTFWRRQLLKDRLTIKHAQRFENTLQLVEVMLGLLFLFLVGTDVAEIVLSCRTHVEEKVIHGLRHLVQGCIDVALSEQRIVEAIL